MADGVQVTAWLVDYLSDIDSDSVFLCFERISVGVIIIIDSKITFIGSSLVLSSCC